MGGLTQWRHIPDILGKTQAQTHPSSNTILRVTASKACTLSHEHRQTQGHKRNQPYRITSEHLLLETPFLLPSSFT